MEYLRKKWRGEKASAPTLEKKHHKYFLRFSYTEEAILSKTVVKEQVVCSVDLGINTDAVCSIMRADGTILGRKFINFSSDKDHLYHVLGRIRRFQREHCSRQVQSRWAYAKRLNMELARNSCGNHKICQRKSGGRNCFWASGNAGKDIREKEAEASFMEKAGYSETVWTSGAQMWNTYLTSICPQHKPVSVWWKRKSGQKHRES